MARIYHRRTYRCQALQFDGTNHQQIADILTPGSCRDLAVGDWAVRLDGDPQIWSDDRFTREWVPAIGAMPPDDYAKTIGSLEGLQ